MKPRLTYRDLEIDKGVNRREITCYTIIILDTRLCNERVYQTLHGGARAGTIFPLLEHKKLILSTDSLPPREFYSALSRTYREMISAEGYRPFGHLFNDQRRKDDETDQWAEFISNSPLSTLLTDYCLMH
jgi:hypothetical protein